MFHFNSPTNLLFISSSSFMWVILWDNEEPEVMVIVELPKRYRIRFSHIYRAVILNSRPPIFLVFPVFFLTLLL